MQLANCLLAANQPTQAAAHYEACLQGPFANDPEIRLGAARARLASGQMQAALDLLQHIRSHAPQFQSEAVTLLLAQTHAALAQHEQAQTLFAEAVQRFGSFEAHAEYAIWAAQSGNTAIAQAQASELQAIQRHWGNNQHAKQLMRPWLKRTSRRKTAPIAPQKSSKQYSCALQGIFLPQGA